MTPTECVDLVEFIAGRCPAMRMQPNTPHTWYVDLVEFDLPDALEAARLATLGKAFISIGDLVDGCQAIVRHRQGAQRRADLEAAIAAENDLPLDDETLTGTPAPLAIEAGPLAERINLYRQGREQGRAEREARKAAKAEARAQRKAHLAAARAELHPEPSDA